MKSIFTIVALPLLLLFASDGSLPLLLLPALSVKAFPASVLSSATQPMTSSAAYNVTAPDLANNNQTTQIAAVTEYPVFISVTEEETQTSPETAESEVVTETYMIIEDQEIDDDDSDSSTMSPAVMRSTTPMPSPKSSPEQEEVLRELKKLWDLSEGMSDNGNDALKNSLSSIVHLAYARVYIEPDETLLKLKYLLQQLQERILLGTNLNDDDESRSTTKVVSSSFSSLPGAEFNESTSYSSTTTLSTSTPMTATTESYATGQARTRRKRDIYGGYNDDDDEIEAIFFANVNSEENSVIPEEMKGHQGSQTNHRTYNTLIKNDSNVNIKDPVDRTLLSLSTISSTASVMAMSSTTPSTVVQKVIHIHDRQKPMPSFYLSPERIKELKSRVTSSTTRTTTTSTLPPISITIDNELENEVNHLQQQQNVDNYDIHISSSEKLVPLTTTTPSNSSFHKKPLSGGSTIVISPSTTTEFPYTAEDIALALFQLLRPDTFDDDDEREDDSVTMQPHPTPSNILYQVGSLSSVLNFTINKSKNISTTGPQVISKIKTTSETPLSSTIAPEKENATMALLKLKEKHKTELKNNATILARPPSLLLDLASSNLTTSTERQNHSPNNDVYDYTDVVDQTPTADQTSITTNIIQGTQDSVQQMVSAVTRLSVGAKMVLLFSISISILSIGFGIYALGPPLAGVGVLGIVIPIGLLLLFETTSSSGKRKLTTRQQEQLLINKLQSEEFSKVVDMIFDAVIKYSKG